MLSLNKIKGFTLAELLVVITLFTTVMLVTSGIYTRYSSAERKLRAQNDLYEETRFTLERIAKEFREGTIDYEEYWNQANTGNCALYSSGMTVYEESYGTYGNCYKAYGQQFYDSDGLNTGQNPNNADDETEQAERNAISLTGALVYQQTELYVINNSGNQKTLLRCLNCNTDPNDTPGKLQILSLNGYDAGYTGLTNETSNDGIIDTWVCGKDYTCGGTLSNGTVTGSKIADNNDGWVDYSPSSLDITDLKFFIAPLEDPRKAYNEDMPEVQMQPHLNVVISAQTAKQKAIGLAGSVPEITLQSTLSGRVFSEVR